MKEELLKTMSKDLGIIHFRNESIEQFKRRVLYSALACWIKTSSADCPIGNTDDKFGVSRRHVFDRCSAVLEEMLKRFPECKSYFDDSDALEDHPVSILRDRLLRHGELVNVGFKTDIAMAKSSQTLLSKNLYCIKGDLIPPNMKYSGIAVIEEIIKEDTTTSKEAIQTVDDWVKQYIRNAWWKTDRLPVAAEFFNPYKKAQNNHSCWQPMQPKPILGVVFARLPIRNNQFEYFLYKPATQAKHQIDHVLQKFGEHRRFMMGLRVCAGNPVPMHAIKYPDHVALSLRVHLPQKEACLLESFAWPHNRMTDKLNWDMPLSVWEYVKPYLVGAGLKLSEEDCNG